MTLGQDVGLAASAVAGLCCFYWMRPRRAATDDEPRCGGCGYIVFGLPGPICPECGSDLRLVPVVHGKRPLRGPPLALLWTGFVFLTVFVPGCVIYEQWVRPHLPSHYEFRVAWTFYQPFSERYRAIYLWGDGEGYGAPRAAHLGLSLTRAGNDVRAMTVEPGRLGYRYTVTPGETVVQGRRLDEEAIMNWFADAGIRPTEDVRNEARVVMAAIHAVNEPDSRLKYPSLAGTFRSGGSGDMWSDQEPLGYDFPVPAVAILVWLWPVLKRQWRWHWTFLRPGKFVNSTDRGATPTGQYL